MRQLTGTWHDMTTEVTQEIGRHIIVITDGCNGYPLAGKPYPLDLWLLIFFKLFSAMPTHMMISVPSFMEIPPINTEILRHAK